MKTAVCLFFIEKIRQIPAEIISNSAKDARRDRIGFALQ